MQRGIPAWERADLRGISERERWGGLQEYWAAGGTVSLSSEMAVKS